MTVEEKMNQVLEKLGIRLRAVWCPDPDNSQHARIDMKEGLVLVFDEDEDEALRSLFHECLEYRLRNMVSPYREIINKLIEAIEEITYREKEKVLDQIMNDFMVWKEFGFSPSSINREIEGVSKSDKQKGLG